MDGGGGRTLEERIADTQAQLEANPGNPVLLQQLQYLEAALAHASRVSDEDPDSEEPDP